MLCCHWSVDQSEGSYWQLEGTVYVRIDTFESSNPDPPPSWKKEACRSVSSLKFTKNVEDG